jgi:hypothetical protein
MRRGVIDSLKPIELIYSPRADFLILWRDTAKELKNRQIPPE